MVRSSYDVVVVGAGPVGSVSAVAAARAGARVLLLEANPEASRRFAGEWLHPMGVSVLDRLRIGRLSDTGARTGYGFVVFPDDGSDPVELGYPEGNVALACEHHQLVEGLRLHARECELVDYLPHARVSEIGVDHVTFRTSGGERRVSMGRIVGADGRSSVARKSLGYPSCGAPMSYMASVEFRGVELPVEGYGHVVLGGPGPVLLYRIAPDVIRGCFDVPLSEGARRSPGLLWDGFAAVLPERLRLRFREALERGPVLWTVNRFSPRAFYGQGRVWLAGDSVGHLHPMTAAGMTLGFLDAEQVGAAPSHAAYRKKRERESYVPELLSNALYHVFSREDRSAAQIRSAVYDVWRGSRFERERTMRILMGAEPRRAAFGAAFSRMALAAVGHTVRESVERREVKGLASALATYGEWAVWPLASVVPERWRRENRRRSTSEHPLPLTLFAPASSTREPPPEAAAGASTASPTPEAETLALSQALSLAGDTLLMELRRLHEQISRQPDWSLIQRATRIIASIDAADLGPAMSAKMRLAKRPLARTGLERLMRAHAADHHLIRGSDVASLMLSLLAVQDGETIDRLDDGVRYLSACQRESGGFAPWPSVSAPADFESTQFACRALARCAERYGHDSAFLYAESLERARRFLLGAQQKDGGWAPSELESRLSNTAHAMRALAALGMQPSSPVLRRAARFLVSQQGPDGRFRSHDQDLTARAVLGLLSVRGAQWGAVQRALPHLLSVLKQIAETDASDLPPGLTFEGLCEVVDALTACELSRRARPRPDVGRERPHHGDDWTYCKQSLVAVSRTFSKPIALLPGDLEVAVTLGYLLCRIADTVEDHPAVPRADKDRLFEQFLGVVERGDPPREFELGFATIEGDDAELSLSRNLTRVMRVFRTLPDAMQQVVSRWVCEMARGMSLYTHREPGADGFVALYTVEDLERYCYYVAGTVGHMLTELFAEYMGPRLDRGVLAEMRHHAEAFGAGLQLVNILKDVTDDRERRWSFVPRASCERGGLSIRTLTDAGQRGRAHRAVEPLFDLAKDKLDRALEYALAVPEDQVGVRLFCLLPLWMAALTLAHARGNDAMFVPGHEVKISRQTVERVIAECTAQVGNNGFLRARYHGLWSEDAAMSRTAG